MALILLQLSEMADPALGTAEGMRRGRGMHDKASEGVEAA